MKISQNLDNIHGMSENSLNPLYHVICISKLKFPSLEINN